MRFLFFSRTRPAKPQNPGQREPFGAAIYCFCSCFSRNAKVGNPTHGLCICKVARETGEEVWLALAATRLKGFSVLALVVSIRKR